MIGNEQVKSALRFAGAIALAVGVLVQQSAPGQAQGRAAPVAVDAVVVEPLTQTAPVLGRFVAQQRGTVAALTRGPVLQVHVAVGDRVREGDILITQSTDRLERSRDVAQAAVNTALAAVATARSQLELAQQELDRLEKLRGSAAFSGAQRDDKAFEVAVRRAQVGEARAEVARAEALLEEAQLDVDLGTIRAPFNGVVVDRHTVRGAYMNIGDAAVTLVNDEVLEVEADVPTDRVAGLEMGREVELLLGGGEISRAFVRAVVPEENALTRTRLVRFIPDLDDLTTAMPAVGQSVTVRLPVGDVRDVLTVHKDAVLPRGGQTLVYVVGADNTVSPRPVQLGDAAGARFVVLGGLAEGELVVTLGNERLRPGQAVAWPGMPEPEAAEPDDAAPEEPEAEARTGTSG